MQLLTENIWPTQPELWCVPLCFRHSRTKASLTTLVEPNPACIADTQVQVVTMRPTAAAGSGAEFIVSQNTVKQNVVKIQ